MIYGKYGCISDMEYISFLKKEKSRKTVRIIILTTGGREV
jgi:hypothetical protein